MQLESDGADGRVGKRPGLIAWLAHPHWDHGFNDPRLVGPSHRPAHVGWTQYIIDDKHSLASYWFSHGNDIRGRMYP